MPAEVFISATDTTGAATIPPFPPAAVAQSLAATTVEAEQRLTVGVDGAVRVLSVRVSALEEDVIGLGTDSSLLSSRPLSPCPEPPSPSSPSFPPAPREAALGSSGGRPVASPSPPPLSSPFELPLSSPLPSSS